MLLEATGKNYFKFMHMRAHFLLCHPKLDNIGHSDNKNDYVLQNNLGYYIYQGPPNNDVQSWTRLGRLSVTCCATFIENIELEREVFSCCLGATWELFEADWKLSKTDLNLIIFRQQLCTPKQFRDFPNHDAQSCVTCSFAKQLLFT